jgi:hypothetical protein
MELHQRLEQILVKLRPVFSREATFEWFLLLLWGVLLNTQAPGVTSYLNALGLGEGYYHQALHWFHSSAFYIDDLCYCWGRWLSEHESCHRLNGQRVYIGDGIKVGKEGRKMPGVKRLHQESGDVNKPEWIRGHYFSALGMLCSAGSALFAVPVILKLHDGIEGVQDEPTATLVEKMARLCVEFMATGSYAILDAYYAAQEVLNCFRKRGLHLITRVRISTVAYAGFCRARSRQGGGRPRKWSTPVKLCELFAPLDECVKVSLWLYGQTTTVYYQCFELYWDRPDVPVLFVLTQFANGQRMILRSTDLNLSGQQVIEAYSWRFKIEVSFRTLVLLLGGFCYRFWLKSMETAIRWPQNLRLVDYPETFHSQVSRKIEAFERFINLNAIALGLLQILALEMPQHVWLHFPRWFRTLPDHGYPTEQIVRLSIQSLLSSHLARSRPHLLLTKLLASKCEDAQRAHSRDQAA